MQSSVPILTRKSDEGMEDQAVGEGPGWPNKDQQEGLTRVRSVHKPSDLFQQRPWVESSHARDKEDEVTKKRKSRRGEVDETHNTPLVDVKELIEELLSQFVFIARDTSTMKRRDL
jgi:hypothetical protein